MSFIEASASHIAQHDLDFYMFSRFRFETFYQRRPNTAGRKTRSHEEIVQFRDLCAFLDYQYGYRLISFISQKAVIARRQKRV